MRWTLEQSSAPSTEPVSRTEAKTHLRVDHTDEDSLIDRAIRAARRSAEQFTARSLIQQTWKLHLDGFPAFSTWPILLPRPPVSAVSSITYEDTDGNTQTWDSAKYRTDLISEPARITPAHGESYPGTRNEMNVVTVTYDAGYGTSAGDVPADIREAILLMLGDLYVHREETVVGSSPSRLPQGVRSLLWPYRVVMP